ncbi:N-acyl homoserine lactonase family protein [Dactylosporangium fulvum]|uniref:N-acyl homoserine lactonase family protein n=1 Tax=Dactylosporangium fulvum TaxID=53359 RepID=A0ABY5WD12_9ACTN|nr:N-acyl homoserine lactonase family protein [Dactylosporangium fulvum]UWP86111.1 N-acyl homoserine lactonase family protein [Dactylosporangium fulvum]
MQLHLLLLGMVRGADLPVPGYLIVTDAGDVVLVDTGPPAGGPPDGPLRVDEHHRLLPQLELLGVRPADVRYVICSHLDPDHAGNHDSFPGARFVIQRAHYDVARSGAVPRFELTRAHWDDPRLRYSLVDGDTELVPGIELIESGGHVPGHQSVLVRLPRTGPVLLAIDAIPNGLALDPQQRPVFPLDLDAEAVRDSTGKLVKIAQREGALIVRGHDPQQWRQLITSPYSYQ